MKTGVMIGNILDAVISAALNHSFWWGYRDWETDRKSVV